MLTFTLFTYLHLKINVHRKDKVTFSVLSLNPPEVIFYTHVRTDLCILILVLLPGWYGWQ